MKQKLDILKENQPGNKKQKNHEQQKRISIQTKNIKTFKQQTFIGPQR